MAPRQKKEYEEREPDSTGTTPLQRFEQALRKVISTPKENIKQPPSAGDKRASA